MNLHIAHAPGVPELAAALVQNLKEAYSSGAIGLFMAPVIVVPNNTMKAWLRHQLAQEMGVVPGIIFKTPDSALWDLLVEQPSTSNSALGVTPTATPPRFLDAAQLQRLIYSYLQQPMAADAPELSPVWEYIGGNQYTEWAPDANLRAWQLAEKLARLFQDYEIQEPNLVEQWQNNHLTLVAARHAQHAATEAWQQRIYCGIFGDGGWRDQTLPGKYTLPGLYRKIGAGSGPGSGVPQFWFATGNLTAFQMKVLVALAPQQNFFLYLPAARWQGFAANPTPAQGPPLGLLELWGQPTLANIQLVQQSLQDNPHALSVRASHPRTAPVATAQQSTLLTALQNTIVEPGLARQPAAQDTSLQVWGCPGPQREVETVYNLILSRMADQPGLRLTDIAVLVTEMDTYLPYLREVFSRHDPEFLYNLVDANAATTSLYSTAVTSLLALVGSSFTRREVFALLTNPCFLAGVAADAALPAQWLDWAAQLGIYFSYDGAMKRTICEGGTGAAGQNLPNSAAPSATPSATPSEWGDAHTWLAGLRRLRLGRIMASRAEAPEPGKGYHWQGFIPYSDMETGGSSLEKFSYAVELLFQQCRSLEATPISGLTAGPEKRLPSQWGEALGKFLDACLAIPQEAPEEGLVRQAVRASLNSLAALDGCFSQGVPLDFARNHLLSGLETIPVSFGKPLLQGVTITSLRQGRLLPFKEIYIVGLGEGQFPAQPERSTLDLRQATSNSPGRSAPEQDRQLFLDALLSAQNRLVLTYSNKDLEKDAELGPCSLINQLKSFLARVVLPSTAPFVEGEAPLHGRSPAFLLGNRGDHNHGATGTAADQPLDILKNYDAHDFWLARQSLSEEPLPELQELNEALALPGVTPTADARGEALSLHCRDLKNFLINPVEGELKRRLKLRDDTADDAAEVDQEPFRTQFPADYQLAMAMMERYLRHNRGAHGSFAGSAAIFETLYTDAHLRSHTPDGIYKQLEGELLQHNFETVVQGPGGLDFFLGQMANKEFQDITMGAAHPAEGQLAFPALVISVPDSLHKVALCGAHPLVWRDEDSVHLLVLTNSKQPDGFKPESNLTLNKHMLEPLLFIAALKCSTEALAGLTSGQAWVGERDIALHLRFKDGIHILRFAIPALEARAYLEQLVSACLRPDNFEDLPLSQVLNKGQLPNLENPDPIEYAQALQAGIDKNGEGSWGQDKSRMELLGLMQDLVVPTDALAKVRSRLLPLCNWRKI